MKNRLMPALISLAMMLTIGMTTARAQEDEGFKNLKVLPDSISREDLLNTMRGFTEALGVRCEFCHVSKEASPRPKFDFPADDKETKRTARLMMRMTAAINGDYLAKLQNNTDTTSGAMPPETAHQQAGGQVLCITCHRGFEKPMTIQQVLDQKMAAGSVEAALASYDSLRQAYYGSGGYDFSEPVLTRLAAGLEHDNDVPGALMVLKKNAEYFPESVRIKMMMAMINDKAGNTDEAIKLYQEVLKLDPENKGAKERLSRLKQ